MIAGCFGKFKTRPGSFRDHLRIRRLCGSGMDDQSAVVMLGWNAGMRKTLSAVLIFGLLALAAGWFVLRRGPGEVPPPVIGAEAVLPADHPETPAKSEEAVPPQPEPMVADLGGGRFSVGAVVFDRNKREITIPAAVNMREGPVEYVLVARHGKVHESVFTTDAGARDIHVAALLLGVKPEPDLGPENAAATVRRPAAVVIRVEWDRNGPPESVFLNETVNLSNPSNGNVSGTLPSGAWLYNGSRIESDGVFTAARDGSIISIIRDQEALVNFPGVSRDNDEIHTPNASKLPKKDHPVRVILKVN